MDRHQTPSCGAKRCVLAGMTHRDTGEVEDDAVTATAVQAGRVSTWLVDRNNKQPSPRALGRQGHTSVRVHAALAAAWEYSGLRSPERTPTAC